MRLLLISLVLLVAAGLLYTLGGPWNVNVRTQAFRDAIRGADEVVIGSGGGYILRDMLDCGAHETVFTRITDPAALRTLARNLEFEADPDPGCKCCGYPGLDWYRNGKRIAQATIHHRNRMRCKGLVGDSTLTPRARQWLLDWLEKFGVPSQDEYAELRHRDLPLRIEALVDAKVVELRRFQAEDYGLLRRLERVAILDLEASTIEDLNPLEGLRTLVELNLSETRAHAIAPLANLLRLRGLHLDNTRVTDLRPLARLTRLERLSITWVQGMDLKPLASLKQLKELCVYGVDPGDAILDRLRAILPGCQLVHAY